METSKPENNSHILEVKGLCTYFYSINGIAKEVNNVSISLKKGEILGIVGLSLPVAMARLAPDAAPLLADAVPGARSQLWCWHGTHSWCSVASLFVQH